MVKSSGAARRVFSHFNVLLLLLLLWPLEAAGAEQRGGVRDGLRLLRRLHVPGDGLAGLRSEVLLPLLR